MVVHKGAIFFFRFDLCLGACNHDTCCDVHAQRHRNVHVQHVKLGHEARKDTVNLQGERVLSSLRRIRDVFCLGRPTRPKKGSHGLRLQPRHPRGSRGLSFACVETS